jgi:flagellar biosynthesis anti-sigma factor FlgM
MRIDLNSRLPESYGTEGRTKSGTAAKGASGGAAADQAHFSSEHQRVQRLEASAGQMPEVRKDKVEALRKAMASGTYAPSAEQIAGAMLQEMVTATR